MNSTNAADYDEPVHQIEASALVYLNWEPDARSWVIDSVTLDGLPLDYSVRPVCQDEACRGPVAYNELSPGEIRASIECSHALTQAEEQPLPTAGQLLEMLAAELGYALMPLVRAAG